MPVLTQLLCSLTTTSKSCSTKQENRAHELPRRMGKRTAWILLSSNSVLGLKCLPMEMKLIQTCQETQRPLASSGPWHAELYLSHILDETDLILFLQLQGNWREKKGRKSNQTQKKNTNKNFPNVFYLTGTKSDIVCSESCCQLFINTLNAAKQLSML